MTDSRADCAVLRAIMGAVVDAMIVSDQSGATMRAHSAAARLFQSQMAEALAAMREGFIAHHFNTGENRIIGLGRDVGPRRTDGTIFPLHLSVGDAFGGHHA